MTNGKTVIDLIHPANTSSLFPIFFLKLRFFIVMIHIIIIIIIWFSYIWNGAITAIEG